MVARCTNFIFSILSLSKPFTKILSAVALNLNGMVDTCLPQANACIDLYGLKFGIFSSSRSVFEEEEKIKNRIRIV